MLRESPSLNQKCKGFFKLKRKGTSEQQENIQKDNLMGKVSIKVVVNGNQRKTWAALPVSYKQTVKQRL